MQFTNFAQALAVDYVKTYEESSIAGICLTTSTKLSIHPIDWLMADAIGSYANDLQ
jgi:hypothetical protein